MAIRKVSNSGLDGSIYKDASAKTSKIADIPDTPTIGTATAGAESATITYTVANTGGIGTTFTALSNPGSITATGSSPITVSGLTGSVSYTFTVRSGNTTGDSAYSSASNSVTPIAIASGGYQSIATVSLTGNQSTITFDSIPQTFQHLQIRAVARTNRNVTDGDYLLQRYNSDSTTNGYYGQHYLRAQNATPYGAGDGTYSANFIERFPAGSTTTTRFGSLVIDIPNYTSTNKYKTSFVNSGYSANDAWSERRIASNIWLNTSVISSITFTSGTGSDFINGTHFALYGLAA